MGNENWDFMSGDLSDLGMKIGINKMSFCLGKMRFHASSLRI